MVAPLCFDFEFDVVAEDEAKARVEARGLIRVAKLNHENFFIQINSIVVD